MSIASKLDAQRRNEALNSPEKCDGCKRKFPARILDAVLLDAEGNRASSKAYCEACFPQFRKIEAVEAPLASQAARDVLAERERQKAVEGWTEAHDDGHADGDMARASACYALTAAGFPSDDIAIRLRFWPWSDEYWKPKDRRCDLIRAGALILAEIERLDRAAIAATDKAAP